MIFFYALLILLIPVTLVIFTKKRATPWRYMYPGLLTFFFFVLIPMIFTLTIGLTNLGTGHIFSKEVALSRLLSEVEIDDEKTILPFEIGKAGVNFQILVDDTFFAEFSLEDNSLPIPLLEKGGSITDPLSKHEILTIQNDLKQLRFKLSPETLLTFYRTDFLAQIHPRFILQNDGSLIERKTEKRYVADPQSGYFVSDNEKLAPGFYVFTGLSNYLQLFTDKELQKPFFKVFTWTILWALISVFLSFSAGMLLALLTNGPLVRAKSFFRILIIIPYSIPFFISVLVFKGIFNQDFGILNKLLSLVAISPIPWLQSEIWAKVSVLLVNFWLGFPYMFLVITGILQSIPSSVYEAAKLDGAKSLSTFFHITLPLIMSAVAPLLIGSFAFNLNNFVGIYLLTGGLPPMQNVSTPVGETDILISYTYRLAFEGGQGQNFGLASSISLFIFVIIAILTVINFKLTQRKNHD